MVSSKVGKQKKRKIERRTLNHERVIVMCVYVCLYSILRV